MDIVRAGLPPGVPQPGIGTGFVARRGSGGFAGYRCRELHRFAGCRPFVAAAAVTAGARVQLEMGGKNPLVVLDDADLPTAVSVAINGAFFQAGRRCTASSRLIVTEGIHDRFVAAMIERMKALVIDDARSRGPRLGQSWTSGSWRRTSSISASVAMKAPRWPTAEIACAARPRGTTWRRRFSPTRHQRCGSTARRFLDPIASVIVVKDYEAALAMANDTPYGLSAASSRRR